MTARGRRWVLALASAVLPILAGCGTADNAYKLPPMLAGPVRLDAALSDAAGTPAGTRTTARALGVRVWLTEHGVAVDSTITDGQGGYFFVAKLNHAYRTQAGVWPVFADSSNEITTDRPVGFFPDTLRLRRQGDLTSAPNPFTFSVMLSFQLAADAHVDVGIYDLMARPVRVLASRTFVAGSHQLVWDGKDDVAFPVLGGMYWVLLRTASETRAELVIKGP